MIMAFVAFLFFVTENKISYNIFLPKHKIPPAVEILIPHPQTERAALKNLAILTMGKIGWKENGRFYIDYLIVSLVPTSNFKI